MAENDQSRMYQEERQVQGQLSPGACDPVFNGGVGLRPSHYPDYLAAKPQDISWLEIISENYFDTQGRPRRILRKLRQDFPFACHGVSLSIASPEELDFEYLKKIKRLIDEVEPFVVSDHLCWTGFSAHNAHDLLPIPHNEETLDFVAEKVQKVQEFLGRSIALENVSAYIESTHATMSEAEFLAALSRKTGCKLLLDINNIYVSETNFNRNPQAFVDAIPRDSIAQIHLAGFSDEGDFLFDTHSNPVFPKVWDLYQYALPKVHAKPTLLEWDENIPPLARLVEELKKAEKLTKEFLVRKETNGLAEATF